MQKCLIAAVFLIWKKKIQVGMTMPQVMQVLGQPSSGYSPRDTRPDQMWNYADPVAPLQTLMITFTGGKISKILAPDNMAMPQI